MKIYWTYSRVDLTPDQVNLHEISKARLSNDKYHIGGLNRMMPIFTHCITSTGYLHALNYCPGQEVHLALIGGLNKDCVYSNTITTFQLLALGNLVRLYMSMGEVIEEGDLSNFNLKSWLKGINK